MDPSQQNTSNITSASNTQRVRRKNGPHPTSRHGSTGALASTSNNFEDSSSVAYSHHRNSSITIDGHSVTADEGSESVLHIRPRIKNPRHTKVINTIVLWVKNVNKMRAMQICKAFYSWKHHTPPAQTNDSSSENSKVSTFSDQKSSYLQLFADNEKLREQLFEIKKVMKQNEKYMRYASMKTLLSTIIRKKVMNKVRYYYDVWFHNVRLLRLTADTRVRTMELEIGLQQIASEQDSMSRYKQQNHVLTMSLATVIFFFKWKNKTILSLLAAERHKYSLQQNTLYAELKRLKEKVAQSNSIEREYLQKGLQRGDQTKEQLDWLSAQLQSLLIQSRAANATLPTSTTGATLVPPYSNNNNNSSKKSPHHKKASSNGSVASTASFASASVTTPPPTDHSPVRKLFPAANPSPNPTTEPVSVPRSRPSMTSRNNNNPPNTPNPSNSNNNNNSNKMLPSELG